MIVRAEIGGHAAVGCDADLRRFVEAVASTHHASEAGRRHARGLDVAGQAYPPQFLRVRLPLRKSGVIGNLEGAMQKAREIAAVVGRPDGRLVGHRLLRDQVAATDFGAVDAELACRFVHKPLEHVARLGTSGPAVRIRGHGIRKHACHLHVNGGCAVHAGEQRAIDRARDGGAKGRDISANIRARVDSQGEKAPVAIQGEGGARAMVPALRVRQKGFAPRGHPAHRPAQAARRPGDDALLRIMLAFVSEPAAHIRRYHAQFGLLQPELGADAPGAGGEASASRSTASAPPAREQRPCRDSRSPLRTGGY